ncbi:MAG: alpha amylase C-terminal domain-containing protein [Bacteroidota bacterium]
MQKPILVQNDPWLEPYQGVIQQRINKTNAVLNKITSTSGSLESFAMGHHYFGLHRMPGSWVFREWAPNATAIFLIGEFNDWQEQEAYQLQKISDENWEIELPVDRIQHQKLYKLKIYWHGGSGERLPSYTKRVVQDPENNIFSAQVWQPESPYEWYHPKPVSRVEYPFIYESHVGMATEDERVGTYNEFREHILPRIKKAGYNTVQLMAIMEHPYYGSFGYHVSNYFAASSRFGTPEELKMLIDTAHGMGIAVIMDVVHSHSVKNENEGLGRFDGTPYQYFHDGPRREHKAWDSLCFDYGKDQVMHFLLSNIRFWMEEYHFDGFRFDGVTSMIYYDHGLEKAFTSYDSYFDGGQDEDALTYLTLANKLIHSVNPDAISVAEEVSGMPGLAAPVEWGGQGFDFRLAMGTPDYWIKIIKEKSDDAWNMTEMFHELSSHRADEKTIGYAESHDQALVGDKTIIFRLIDKEMYWHMNKDSENLLIDRGIALHKMIRLITAATAGGGYLNFMGNEFGHPEWIDFPREGNNWSYKYARRQWSLVDNENLRYQHLAAFDKAMVDMLKHEQHFQWQWCHKINDNSHDNVLAFTRGDLLFVFNFHPTNSYTDYGLFTQAGKYHLLLNSDRPDFGGFNRIDESITYFTEKTGKIKSPTILKLYLPSRVGMVFKREYTPSVRDKLRG